MRQWNRLLDAVVTIFKYNKTTIDYDIYIKVFSDGTISHITVSHGDVLNTTNNNIYFPELRRVFEEYFEVKVQKGSVFEDLNSLICQYSIGVSVDQTDHIVELVNEWFPTRKCINVDTSLRKDSIYEKKLMAILS